MPLVKCINGHTGCAAAERYLERGGRAIGHDFINLDCGERLDGPVGWSAEMDGLRDLHGNGKPYRGKPAITYRHYIVSPDPADKIDLERLRELACAWARRHFGEYQVAIVYHDDNENRIPHAHIIVNNTNVESGRRLHVPDPKKLNRDLQEMARKRDLGYLADRRTADPRVKGGGARTSQREFKGRAERRIEREGGYSWVADIRNRASTARAIASNEDDYRSLLKALGVELSLNSPNARRRDYLYALADHPSRKVGGEKLGCPYGKTALESKWIAFSTLKEEKLRQILEHAILINDLDGLHELAHVMKTIEECHFTSIADIDWTIGRLEKRVQTADLQSQDDTAEKLELIRHARQFAAEHGILPTKEPKPIWTYWGHEGPSPTSWGSRSSSYRYYDSPSRSVEHSRSDWAR